MYEVIFPRRVRKRMSRFPCRDYDRVLQAIRDLAMDPRPPGARKMRGMGNLEELRIRIGDYRVIYRVEEPEEGEGGTTEEAPEEERPEGRVIVLDVGHRQGIYG